MSSNQFHPALSNAARAIVSDNRDETRQNIDWFLTENVDSVDAWLIKAWTADSLEVSLDCFQCALEIEPENQVAKSGLEWIQGVFNIAEERLEAESLEELRIEEERAEQERLESERQEQERQEQERLEAERLEQERLEEERLEAERFEQEQLEQERLEAERQEVERLEQERLEQERLEQERLEQERFEAERFEQEQLEQERLEAERQEQERLEQERQDQERLKEESLQAEQFEQEQLEQERLEAERLEEMLETEHSEQEQLDAESQQDVVHNEQPEQLADHMVPMQLDAEIVEHNHFEASQIEHEAPGSSAQQQEEELLAAERIADEMQASLEAQMQSHLADLPLPGPLTTSTENSVTENELVQEESAQDEFVIPHVEEEFFSHPQNQIEQPEQHDDFEPVAELPQQPQQPEGQQFEEPAESHEQASEPLNTQPELDLQHNVEALSEEVREELQPEPNAQDVQADREADQPNEQSSTTGRKRVVLAVDDSATIRKLVSLTLREQGYEVLTACDGVEALKILAEQLPDLVLSDINMPRLGGYKLCKFIKKHERTASIPVVMLSGKDGVFDKMRGKMNGCDGFIAKPFETSELVEIIGQYMTESAPTIGS